MNNLIPNRLTSGDQIRVVAPSRSASIITTQNNDLARDRLIKEFGVSVTFSKHHQEKDMFSSSSVESRVADLHDAFGDNNVKMISTAIGGFNSNQLLKYLDWDLIRNNPKIFCGYSDITVLANAILTKTGLVTYIGPHFSSFAQKEYLEYTIEYFKKCLIKNGDYSVVPSKVWLDDQWYRNQENRKAFLNEGYWVMKPGIAEGVIVGGNLSSFSLLFGTEFMPDISEGIVFLEIDNYTQGVDLLEFERQLQTFLLQKGSERIKGIIVGRFQTESDVTREKLQQVINTKKELENIPVIANVDFGHTNPMITFPIGGICKIRLVNDMDFEIKISG